MFELLNGRGSAGPGQPAPRGMPMDVYRDGDKYVCLAENTDGSDLTSKIG